MTTALTRGAHHVGLAVLDLDEATRFFCDALGFSVAGERPAYPARFVSDGTTLLTLWQVSDPATATRFDRRVNVGLHHLALAVADDATLETVHLRVSQHPGVVVEFAPEPAHKGATRRHFICAMPGGIRIEFATPFA
jgi:catechol 2,3-dioxygenase-like lactoylglutathione lyase family enzyme